ncbi:MAG: ABC transporter permease, partial [Phycisphaeraceae bacterium]|nr:ABC transporter permease [Phycisphaeraceae bacterium]
REGFMQGVLVAPMSRLAIVLGKVLGGAIIATVQGLIFLVFWPVIAPWPGVGMMLGALLVMFVIAISMTALGMCFAWNSSSTAGFHAIMNLILMPLWFLSGAMFPVSQAPLAMKIVMYANPLTYGQELMVGLMSGNLQSTLLPFGVMLGISIAMMCLLLLACYRMVNRSPRGV